jgi:AmiR/NasT family two-component response regulator
MPTNRWLTAIEQVVTLPSSLDLKSAREKGVNCLIRKGLHMGRVERDREIARRRTRRAKLKKLRAKYDTAQTQDEKDEIFAKARKLSPFISFEDAAQA